MKHGYQENNTNISLVIKKDERRVQTAFRDYKLILLYRRKSFEHPTRLDLYTANFTICSVVLCPVCGRIQEVDKILA
jgi:hypothetical protein